MNSYASPLIIQAPEILVVPRNPISKTLCDMVDFAEQNLPLLQAIVRNGNPTSHGL